MKAIRTLLLLSCLVPVSVIWAEESTQIQVIVNGQSELTELNRKQVMSLFFGAVQKLPEWHRGKTLDNAIGSNLRERFFEELTGKSISDIDAYWARLRYSGRAAPPKVLDGIEEILVEVGQNQNAIAYVSQQNAEDLAQKGIVVVHTVEGR